MVSRVLLFLASGLAILACGATDGDGDPAGTDADADTDSDIDSDADADGDTESGTGLDWLCDGPIAFPDQYLEEAVREAIGEPSGDILLEDLEPVTTFGVSGSYYPVESKVFDLTGMQCMRNLEVVFFLGTNAFTNVDPLAAAEHLRVLLIDYAPLEDLNGLGETTQLIQLEIGSSLLDDIGPLAGHQSMIRLALRGQIDSVEPLASMTQIVFLDLSQNNISDISALAGMTQMETLNLSHNQISNVGPLAEMTEMKSLLLTGNPIDDLSAISGMVWLEKLVIWEGSIEDLSPLEGCTSLQVLEMPGHSIESIAAIADLDELVEVWLAGNAIATIQPLTNVAWGSIEKLWLGGNSIADLQPLVENQATFISDVEIDVSQNPIDCADQAAHIQALLDRGVVLYCDCDECY
jgi:internalin A